VLGVVFLAITFLAALVILIALDIVAAVSAHRRFVALFSGFWMLLGLALLHGCPWRLKLLILGLFATSILLVCAIRWNHRKPLLQSLYRIRVGMTETEVDGVMENYAKQAGSGAVLNGKGEIVAGTVCYRCPSTDRAGSMTGVLTFEMGRVVQIGLQPDAVATSHARESG
jgi:hypothetical protein